MKRLIIVLALLSLPGFAQTLTTTIAAGETYLADPYDITVTVTRYPVGQCGLTCTVVVYTFCKNQVPGCLEGWTEVPNSTFKGGVGSNWTNNAVMTLADTYLVSDGLYGLAWDCYAWDDSGNCTDQITVHPVNGSPNNSIGMINMNWKKVTVAAQISTVLTYEPGTTSTYIVGKFTAQSTGTIIGTPISTNGTCCLAYVQSVTKTNAVASQILADKLSPNAIKHLKAIENKMRHQQ